MNFIFFPLFLTLPIILGGNIWYIVIIWILLMLLLPSIIGYYFKQYKIVQRIIYLLYICAQIYAIYTVYIAITCWWGYCGFIIFAWILSIISANFFLFCFLFHFKKQSIWKSLKVLWLGILIWFAQSMFLLWGIFYIGLKVLGEI